MTSERHTVGYYAKLFLLMIIPVYGFFFTILLAFSKDVSDELKTLAKGALIARIAFLVMIIIGFAIFTSMILPMINNFLNNLGVLKLFN